MTVIRCPNCASENPTKAKYCFNCGDQLEGGESDSRLASLQQSAPSDMQERLRAARGSVEGERKPVTMLFADIVGSTSIAEKLDPEEWKEIVAGMHRRVGEAIYRYEGTIAQLLGDGVLAFFGGSITHEDDPIRAVRAALDIQRVVSEYERELAGLVDSFEMRVGINTGTVVIGEIGSDMHVEYLAIGDAVNTASRLQAAANPGEVLISDATARLIGNDFQTEERGELEVKGRSEAVRASVVLGLSGIPRIERGIPGERAPYVGRAAELEILQSKLHALSKGQGQIVAILGEPGIGKSRLVEEARHLSDDHNIRWLEGRALSYGSSLSFWLITQLLLDDLDLADGAAAVRIKVTLRNRVVELFGDKAEGAYPYVGHLLGLTDDADVQEIIRELDGETVKRQTLITVAEYFQKIAQQQPTVLVLEDLHWADPSSLEAASRLMPLTDRTALMVLMPMRIERQHGSWRLRADVEIDYTDRFTELHLKRLPDDKARQLVQDLLGNDVAAEEIQDLVGSRAEGNPLHLEEIVRHLIERGLIERENGNWEPTDAIEEVGIPTTLEGVLLARIDRLEMEVRNTLQLASVIGRSFLYRILEAISDAERELDWQLSQLQRADLIRERARHPELEYMFKHALTQEAAYNSLLRERRKEFHTKVGNALEQLFSDREEEFVGLLAYHYDKAENPEKSLKYLVRAGDKARLEDALEEALDYYDRALHVYEQTGDNEGAARTWLKIGLVHMKDFNFGQANLAQEAAFELQRTLSSELAQQKPSRQSKASEAPILRILEVLERGRHEFTLDPGAGNDIDDAQLALDLFAGLTEIDSETNVVPHVARSWQVLDGGRRYVFQLREDVYWSDGEQLTAADFKWAWLRNLALETESYSVPLLDIVSGARDFRTGVTEDPDAVDIRDRSPFTLEVKLDAPVPYFVYITAMPSTFPLPRHAIEKYGEGWWEPTRIVSNGPFQIRRLDSEAHELVRNPNYFGRFEGNIGGYERLVVDDDESAVRAYSDEEVDVVSYIPEDKVRSRVPSDEVYRPAKYFNTMYLVLNPNLPPFDDYRVRKALAHATEWGPNSEGANQGAFRRARGGLVPEGMPGHSPEIGLKPDLAMAKDLLDNAGYPEGKGLPKLTFAMYGFQYSQELLKLWKDTFGIVPEVVDILYSDHELEPAKTHIFATGWVADYPDPNNFLRTALHDFLLEAKWQGIRRYNRLLEKALHSTDRAERLEVYRQADRWLVSEEVLVVPLKYGRGERVSLVKSYVSGFQWNAMGYLRFKEISIEPH